MKQTKAFYLSLVGFLLLFGVYCFLNGGNDPNVISTEFSTLPLGSDNLHAKSQGLLSVRGKYVSIHKRGDTETSSDLSKQTFNWLVEPNLPDGEYLNRILKIKSNPKYYISDYASFVLSSVLENQSTFVLDRPYYEKLTDEEVGIIFSIVYVTFIANSNLDQKFLMQKLAGLFQNRLGEKVFTTYSFGELFLTVNGSEKWFNAAKSLHPELSDINMRMLRRGYDVRGNIDMSPIFMSSEFPATFVYYGETSNRAHNYLIYYVPGQKSVFLIDSIGNEWELQSLSLRIRLPSDHKLYAFQAYRQKDYISCKMFSLVDLIIFKRLGADNLMKFVDEVGSKNLVGEQFRLVKATPGDFYISTHSVSRLKEMNDYYHAISNSTVTYDSILENAENLEKTGWSGDIIKTFPLRLFVNNIKEGGDKAVESNLKSLVVSFTGPENPTPYEYVINRTVLDGKNKYVSLVTSQMLLKMLSDKTSS